MTTATDGKAWIYRAMTQVFFVIITYGSDVSLRIMIWRQQEKGWSRKETPNPIGINNDKTFLKSGIGSVETQQHTLSQTKMKLGDKEMETTKALNQEALEQISGGGVDMTHLVTCKSNQCMHPHEYKTGEQREDERWIFFSQHQFEYICPDCKETNWYDEEP